MEPEVVYTDSRFEVSRLVVGRLDNNVYFIRSLEQKSAVMIDAAAEPDRLLAVAQQLGVTDVLTTHGHWDHIGAVTQIQAAGIPVRIGINDAYRLPEHDTTIADGDLISIGDVVIECIHTPGHTEGSTCFKIKDSPVLFSGDTLFPGGPGATRLPGSDFPTIMQSIERRMFEVLDDDVIVFPGHGASTTIGTERPSLDAWKQRGW